MRYAGDAFLYSALFLLSSHCKATRQYATKILIKAKTSTDSGGLVIFIFLDKRKRVTAVFLNNPFQNLEGPNGIVDVKQFNR